MALGQFCSRQWALWTLLLVSYAGAFYIPGKYRGVLWLDTIV